MDTPPDGRGMPAAVAERLARLAPDQRAAATAPPGPVLCIAPAGSGKTTTLVARVAWLVAMGADPASITAITFNARAAEELRTRLGPALEALGAGVDLGGGDGQPADDSHRHGSVAGGHGLPSGATGDGAAPGDGAASGGVRARTFHALGLEILRDAGRRPSLVARDLVLRAILPSLDVPGRRRLDDAFSRLKLDLGVTAREVATDPDPGPVARAFLAYEQALEASGACDFDDLVADALRVLGAEPPLLDRWRRRCAHLLVDEVQDVDRSQLRLALLLAAPANRIFLVGDDDQSIYGWRLADVRRTLRLADDLPGLRRLDLEVNYRCPAPVLARAVRLVAHNEERFAKTVRAGPACRGRLVLAPAASHGNPIPDLLRAWPADGTGRAVLARTRRELLPAVAACLEAEVPFRADGLALPLDDPRVDRLLSAALASGPPGLPAAVRLVRAARAAAASSPAPDGPLPPPDGPCDGARAPTPDEAPDSPWTDAEIGAALVGWAVGLPPGADVAAAVAAARARVARLRRPDADLTLATAHATKGLEWDHVAVLGMTEGRFPSARTLVEAADPVRALEEERRLAYVAWTRARRSLTLVYDPSAPSPFLKEAFDPRELVAVPSRPDGPAP